MNETISIKGRLTLIERVQHQLVESILLLASVTSHAQFSFNFSEGFFSVIFASSSFLGLISKF